MKNLIRIAKITLQFKRTLFLNLGFNILGMVFSIFSFAMIIPLLRIIFNSSTAFFEKTISSYSGEFIWTKDGGLHLVNYYLANHARSEGRDSTLMLFCLF